MILYLVGCVSGSKTDLRKYYFGYTHDPHVADRYYDMLVDKHADTIGEDKRYTEVYFIEKLSENKFTEVCDQYANEGFGTIELLEEMPGNGPIVTESEFEEYSTIVGEMYSNITNEMDTLRNISDEMTSYAKYDKRRKLKRLTKMFRKLVKVLSEEYFEDYDKAFEHIDWDKVQRKN